MRKLLAATALAGGLALTATAAHAVPITTPGVSEAITTPGLAFSSNGMTFDDFTASLTMGGIGISTPYSPSQIDVSLISNPTTTGLQINSGFQATFYAFNDAALTYTASSATGISSIGLSFDGYFGGLGISSVTENVYSDPNHQDLVGSATVSCSLAGCSKTDDIALNGIYDTVYVTKDIYVGASFGSAGQSIIDQTYTQVPEPASMALLGSGLFGLGMLRRRRNNIAA